MIPGLKLISSTTMHQMHILYPDSDEGMRALLTYVDAMEGGELVSTHDTEDKTVARAYVVTAWSTTT